MTMTMLIGNPFVLFSVLIIGGETALVPAVYFAYLGVVDYLYIIPLALVTTLIIDTVWYFLGSCIKYEAVKTHKCTKRHYQKINDFSSYFSDHSMKFLLMSKFIFGSRTAAQLLCGIHKVGFIKYTLFNTLGVVFLILFLFVLAPLVTGGVDALTNTVYTIQISFAVFIIVSLGVFLSTKKILVK